MMGAAVEVVLGTPGCAGDDVGDALTNDPPLHAQHMSFEEKSPSS